MHSDLMTLRRRRKLVFGVLAIGIMTSALVALALVYMGRSMPRF
ncbi:MAG TPA: hypothetical protein VKY92_22950 [Verrucomicrobiae bacterium]|jgi:hypothetical protein|nr:hypothetical protein [Verrucomicrobiae bacterium]